jgi:hypothetical protein
MNTRSLPASICLVIAGLVLLCVSVGPVMAAEGQSDGMGSSDDSPNWGPSGWRLWVVIGAAVLVIAGTTALIVYSGGTTAPLVPAMVFNIMDAI